MQPCGLPDGPSRWSIGVAVAGFAVALFGVYWDDAWHTDRGRDGLFSAPHLVLYAGVAAAVVVVAAWGWRSRKLGWRTFGAAPIGVAVVGAAVTLGSAPVDEWWHTAFSRDAVLWSPPHLVALVGTVALGSGVALVAARSLAAGGWLDAVLLLATCVGVVGAWQVLVLEYDTDVAQFSPLWYLPVLAAGVAASSATVHAVVGPRFRWSASWAGVGYSLTIVGVIAVLSAMRFSTPIVPAVIPAMMAADLARGRRWPLALRSTCIVTALFVVYVPYLRAVEGGVAPSFTEVLLGAVVAVAVVSVSLTAFEPRTRWIPAFGPVGAAALVLAVIAPIALVGQRPAAAHDPGQGLDVIAITLTAEVTRTHVELTAILDEPHNQVEPVALVARRAGRLLTGSITVGSTSWSGRVDVDRDGRWFVYVEAHRGAEQLEAWLPVTIGSDGITSKQTMLYVPIDDADTTTVQLAVGITLVLVALAVVALVAATVRATAVDPGRRPRTMPESYRSAEIPPTEE